VSSDENIYFLGKEKTIKVWQLNVIAGFLLADDIGYSKEDAYILEPEYFNTDLREIVILINKETANNDRFYGRLNVDIEEHYPVQWTEIMLQTPLDFNLNIKYYNKLVELRIKEELKG